MPKDIAPPARGFSFKDFSLSKPGQALPGDRLDTELDRLAGKFGDLEDFLLTSFERDGSLKGSTVAQRHLKPDILAPMMRRIDDLIQKARQDLDQREKSTQNLATEARNARTEALAAAQEARGAVQEAKALNQQAQTSAQNANQARARSEAALVPLANLQSDAQTAANSARIAEDMAYRWAEKTDGPVFVPNGGDPVDDGFYSSKFWALFTQTSVENGSFWYLGTSATSPTTGNDGLPLQPGMWYFNTSNGQTFIWNGTAWDPISGAAGTVLSVFGRQGSVQALVTDYQAFYLRLSGGTLTGALTLSASPTALLHAATKGYVDQQDAALDAALRALIASTDTAARAYTDAQVATRLPIAGGQMTGQIKAVGNPVAPEDLGSKGYIDAQVATRLTQAQADARFLQLAGGTLTGPLTLPGDPTQDLQAATKGYADTRIAAAVPDFATDPEAQEGTRTDVTMSPAGTTARIKAGGITLEGGYASVNVADGTFASGTYTPSPVGGNFKSISNAGAFTLAAPVEAGDYTMLILISNAAGAGNITLTGFSRVIGAFTTTVGHSFILSIVKIGGAKLATIQGLQ